jgi:hypothetical protein
VDIVSNSYLNRFDSPSNIGIRSLIYLKRIDIRICKMFELSFVQSSVCPKLWVLDIVEFQEVDPWPNIIHCRS